MKKKLISIFAIAGGIICLVDFFADLGLTGNAVSKNLGGFYGIIFVIYGIVMWTRYETIANGILFIILGQYFITRYFKISWSADPLKFLYLIAGIMNVLIGFVFYIPDSEKK